jgi:hypothetical protein
MYGMFKRDVRNGLVESVRPAHDDGETVVMNGAAEIGGGSSHPIDDEAVVRMGHPDGVAG